MNGKKRVILISGDKTKWYEQAIFIVKPGADKGDIPTDFVAEAEKIINEYLKKNDTKLGCPAQKQKRPHAKHDNGLDFILNGAMFLSCLLLCIILYRFTGF